MGLTVETLVNVEKFIYAEVSSEVMTVYRSLLVHDEADMFGPVRDLLIQRPHRLVVCEVVEDEEMMFGEGMLSVYRFD